MALPRKVVEMKRDLVHAIHGLWRTPLSSGLAVLSLAFGIAVATSLFSVVNGVLLRPLPYADADRVVTVAVMRDEPTYALAGAEAVAVRAMSDVFEDAAILESWEISWRPLWAMSGTGTGERLHGALVDANFFDVLGVSPALGRTFVRGGDDGGVVISDALWRRQFGASRDVLGRTLRLDGVEREVIGVLPAAVHVTYPQPTDAYVQRTDSVIPMAVSYQVVARLSAGVTAAAATSAVQGLAVESAKGSQLGVIPVGDRLTAPIAAGIWMLTMAALVLLGAATANTSLLLITQAVRRTRSLGIRMALGATRWHIFRLLLVEHLLVGAAAVGVGASLAYTLDPLVRRMAPHTLPRLDESVLDVRALAFAALVALACVLVTSVVAHVVMQRSDWRITAGELGRTATTPARALAWRRVLLTAQSALLLVSLSVAGLLLHSFLNVWRLDFGFDTRGVTAVRLTAAASATPETLTQGTGARLDWKGPSARLARAAEALREQLEAVPGVTAVASASAIPFESSPGFTVVPHGDSPDEPRASQIPALVREVSDGYFALMNIPVLEGRAISKDDEAQGRRVTVLSRDLARRVFPDSPAVGRTLYWGEPYEVVGVAGDVRWEGPEDAGSPAFYVPTQPENLAARQIMVRSSLPVAHLMQLVRERMAAIDPLQPVDRVIALDDVVGRSLEQRRFHASATTTFGVLALLLAAIGISAGVAAAVTERTREFGIRSALGASRIHIRWQAMRHALRPVAAGLALGAVATVFVTRALRAFLFELSAFDPWSLTATVIVVTLVAVAAAWYPARHAVRISPVEALRAEDR